MGYYDFDDHFWSPQEVCAKLPAKNNQKVGWGISKVFGISMGRFSRKYESAKLDDRFRKGDNSQNLKSV